MASYLCRLRITASVLFFLVIRYIGMNGASAASAPSSKDAARPDGNQVIQVVFSDVDGTLVHYPEHIPAQDPAILALPPSSTGLRAVISQETLRKCQEIRQSGRKLVLVSGMRTTTLLHRLPFLPRADAYCSEAGGRIFYPTSNTNEIKIEPLRYKGATAESLSSFGLEEDLEWRKIMEEAAGSDGFEGQDLASMASGTAQMIPASQRKGPLWEFARKLESLGLVLDTKGYATSFRVTARQQPASSMKSKEAFQDLLEQHIVFPPEVATRTNLGSVDFYPVSSGKKHCCSYLAEKLTGSRISTSAVCMGDDDNDIEMALACRHAFIPTISSHSMAVTIANHPGQFTAISGVSDTSATEKALDELLRMLAIDDSNLGEL